MPISVNSNVSQYAVLVTDLVHGDKVVQKRYGKSGMLAAAASVVSTAATLIVYAVPRLLPARSHCLFASACHTVSWLLAPP